MDPMLTIGAVAFAGGLGAAAAGAARLAAERGASRDALAFAKDDPAAARGFEQPLATRLAGPAWAALERVAARLTPSSWAARLRRTTQLAGLGRWGVDGLLAMKAAAALAGAVGAPVVMALAGGRAGTVLTWAAAGAVAGFFAPDWWVARRARLRQTDIARTLPEALDLMAIGVQAGMGLEATMALVSERLPGPLGEELNRMLSEVQLGASRREALHHLRDRTDVPELSSFVLALVQADGLGSPLAEVLRVQAGEMRTIRRQRAREQAAKTPVKLLVPLLFGIFPALGIVIMGPAVISIAQAFSR